MTLVADPGSEMTEAQVRKELAACYRLVHHFGMSDLIATHISARLPGEGHRILINPFGSLFNEVKASNLVAVTLDGEVLTEGGQINPAGYLIHSATAKRALAPPYHIT